MNAATTSSTLTAVEQVVRIPLSLIDEDPKNPQSRLKDIKELAKSIEAAGKVYEPIIVVQGAITGRYMVKDGHRRRAAALMLKHKDIPGIIREPEAHSSLQRLVTGLMQNRLSPWETARAVQDLIDEKMTGAQIAAAVGKSTTWVSIFKKISQAGRKILETHNSALGPKDSAELEAGKLRIPGSPLSLEEHTSMDELYKLANNYLTPKGSKNQAAAKKRKAGKQGTFGFDDKQKEAATELADRLAEAYKLPVDNVEITADREGGVNVLMHFGTLAAAIKALK